MLCGKVVEDQDGGEPDEQVFEARIDRERCARGLNADDRQQKGPRQEAGEEREFHVVEGVDVALVKIAAAGEAEQVFGENLLAEKIGAAFEQRRDVPSSGKHEHDERAAHEIHLQQKAPALFQSNPNQGDEARQNQADGTLGQNGERDREVEQHPPARQSLGHENEFEERDFHEEGQRHIDAGSGPGLQVLEGGGEDERGDERGDVVEQAAHIEVADDHAGDGEAGGRQAHRKFVDAAGDQRDERGKPVHQERLGGNFDAGALRQYHAAAVDDVEDGDGLARLALGVERIAAEIYEIEGDADDQQDRPRVARLGDVVEPSGRSGSPGIGARGLFRECS